MKMRALLISALVVSLVINAVMFQMLYPGGVCLTETPEIAVIYKQCLTVQFWQRFDPV
jgi:hypothetical protein